MTSCFVSDRWRLLVRSQLVAVLQQASELLVFSVAEALWTESWKLERVLQRLLSSCFFASLVAQSIIECSRGYFCLRWWLWALIKNWQSCGCWDSLHPSYICFVGWIGKSFGQALWQLWQAVQHGGTCSFLQKCSWGSICKLSFGMVWSS